MITKARVTVAALACAAAPIAGAGTVALATQNATAGTRAAVAPAIGAIPRCLTRHLSVGLHGHQALVANRGFILTLTNTGATACSVDGYPILGIEDARHHALPSHSHAGSTYFDPDPGPSLIVLSPGETASADFAFGTGAGTPATFLEVTPPNALVHLIVRIPGGPAQVVGGRLFVTAMARHTPYNT